MGTQVKELKGHTDSIESVAFSLDGKTLTSGSDNNTIKIWTLESGAQIKELKGHNNNVYSVAFSPDGKTFASGSADETIKIWNLDNGAQIKELYGHIHYGFICYIQY